LASLACPLTYWLSMGEPIRSGDMVNRMVALAMTPAFDTGIV
jgi:hypothetical protein